MQEKTLAEILQEELDAIQDLLEPGDKLIIEPLGAQLEQVILDVTAEGAPASLRARTVAIGSQAITAILEERHAKEK